MSSPSTCGPRSYHAETASGRRSAVELDPLKLAARAWELILTWQRRSDERQHLGRLTPHQLRDIGLSEADVAEEIRKPFWRA